MVADAESKIGPQPPAWFVPAAAPKLSDILTEARTQRDLHAERVLNQVTMDRRLGMEFSAIFNADKAWVDLKEIEAQVSPLLRRIHDAITTFIATQQVQHTSLARGLVNREERAAINGHLAESLRDWIECTFREGQGSLLRVLTADALSGMVAIYHAPDPGNERTGQRLTRVDPKVVFPVFGRDGLDRVYTVYECAYADVMRDYSDGPGGEATKAIQRLARKGSGRGNARIDPDTCYEFIGYWDREFAIITWRGEVVKQWKHSLYVCPWHISPPNWRQTSGTRASAGYEPLTGNRPGPRITSTGVSVPYELVSNGTSRQKNLVRLYEPFLVPWLPVVDKVEKVQTRLAYGVDRALSQPRVHKSSNARSGEGPPEVQNYRDGTTQIEEDEELDKLPMDPINDSFQPWMTLFTMEVQAMIPTPVLQGQTIGSQTSGTAIDAMLEQGNAIFAAVPEFIQSLFKEIGHRDLTYLRDWGPAYGGGLSVATPARGAYGSQPSQLTAEMLVRAGCYIDCVLRRRSLASDAQRITSLVMLKNAGLVTDEWGIAELGLTDDAQGMADDVREQQMEEAPEYASAMLIEYLYEQAEIATANGDQESLRRILSRAKRVAAQQSLKDAQMAAMAGSQPPPMLGPGGGPPGQGPPPDGTGVNPAPYLSSPDFARTTGTQGGAPSLAPTIPGQQG